MTKYDRLQNFNTQVSHSLKPCTYHSQVEATTSCMCILSPEKYLLIMTHFKILTITISLKSLISYIFNLPAFGVKRNGDHFRRETIYDQNIISTTCICVFHKEPIYGPHFSSITRICEKKNDYFKL